MVNINVIGRLGADAELKTSQKGTQFVQFRMGVDDFANGNKCTAWFSVISSTDQAIRMQKYLTKGNQVSVHGTETLRLFTNKNNETVIGRDIMAYSIDFVSSGRKEEATSAASSTTTSQPSITIPTPQPAPAMATASSTDDDLPF